jgi:DNA-binding MarR family transcriptional regulator
MLGRRSIHVSSQLEEDILTSLRRITRAIDIHSRYLANTFGLTGPQLVCLRVLGRLNHTTPNELAKHVSLSQATVTGIVDRLAARQLVTRERSATDRRLVDVSITSAGKALLEQAPSALQETFVERLGELSPTKQQTIRRTLNEIVKMMGGEDLDADPVLSTNMRSPAEIAGPVAEPPLAKRTTRKLKHKQPT